MQKLKVGQKVKIGNIGVIGEIVAIEDIGYRVQFQKRNEKLVRRLFIAEELLPVNGSPTNDEVAAENVSAASSGSPHDDQSAA